MPVSLHLIRVPWRCPLPQARKVAGAAALLLVDGLTPLRPEPALFEAMLERWGRQQRSRRLSVLLVESRERLVRGRLRLGAVCSSSTPSGPRAG